jgi:hypothetical protein
VYQAVSRWAAIDVPTYKLTVWSSISFFYFEHIFRARQPALEIEENAEQRA